MTALHIFPTSSVGVQAGGGEAPGQLLGSGPGPGRRPGHSHQAGHHQQHPAYPGGGPGGGAGCSAAYIGRLVTLRLRGLKCPLDVTLLVAAGRLGAVQVGRAGGNPVSPSKRPSNPIDSRPNLLPGPGVTTWNKTLKLSLGDCGVKCGYRVGCAGDGELVLPGQQRSWYWSPPVWAAGHHRPHASLGARTGTATAGTRPPNWSHISRWSPCQPFQLRASPNNHTGFVFRFSL